MGATTTEHATLETHEISQHQPTIPKTTSNVALLVHRLVVGQNLGVKQCCLSLRKGGDTFQAQKNCFQQGTLERDSCDLFAFVCWVM